MAELTQDQIKHMVDRFLGWKLPEAFCPDAGISFKPLRNEGTQYEAKQEPVGTNLFSAEQAEAMIRYISSDIPLSALDAQGEKPDHCYKCGDYVAPMDRVFVNIMINAAGSVPSLMKLHCSKCAPSFGVRQHGDSGLTGSVPKESPAAVQALREGE